jgi:flagellar hook protein FlgE
MANYSVSVSGIQNTAAALDTVSNNIANANTVGYKAGEYVFADQFAKVTNPRDASRTGMGTQMLNVRRPMIQGTITNSKNPLDLAISGNGMFRLTDPLTQPDAIYYTRNGQFRLDNKGYIVNENGMYLTGYQPDNEGREIQGDLGLLKMPPNVIPGKKTELSKLGVMLDSRATPFTDTLNVAFDPDQSTFNSKTTQTVYDSEGNAHTLEVYYRRVSGNFKGNASTEKFQVDMNLNGYKYEPSINSSPSTLGTRFVELNKLSVLRVNDAATHYNAVESSSLAGGTTTVNFEAPVAGVSTGMRIFLNGVDTGKSVATAAGSAVTFSGSLTLKAGDAISFYAGYESKDGAAADFATNTWAAGTKTLNLAAAPAAGKDLVGYRVFEQNGTDWVDTGTVVTTQSGTALTLDTGAHTFTAGRKLEFRPELSMTLVTPNGAEVDLNGTSNNPALFNEQNTIKLLGNKATVEVYASIDQKFFGKDAGYTTNRDVTAQTTSALGYKPVARIDFVNGRNIDSLIPDTKSANPAFYTDTTLSGKFAFADGHEETYSIRLDLSETTLSALEFVVNKNAQDGEAASRLTNISIDDRGRIAGVYGNGSLRYSGQIVLTHFVAFEMVAPVGENVFVSTPYSGTEQDGLIQVDDAGNAVPVRQPNPGDPSGELAAFSAYSVYLGRPGTAGLGEIRAGALESSTVDLSSELVKLMVLQRTYSSNSQALRAQDQTLQSLLQSIG